MVLQHAVSSQGNLCMVHAINSEGFLRIVLQHALISRDFLCIAPQKTIITKILFMVPKNDFSRVFPQLCEILFVFGGFYARCSKMLFVFKFFAHGTPTCHLFLVFLCMVLQHAIHSQGVLVRGTPQDANIIVLFQRNFVHGVQFLWNFVHGSARILIRAGWPAPSPHTRGSAGSLLAWCCAWIQPRRPHFSLLLRVKYARAFFTR